jgi:hypothetical protein
MPDFSADVLFYSHLFLNKLLFQFIYGDIARSDSNALWI